MIRWSLPRRHFGYASDCYAPLHGRFPSADAQAGADIDKANPSIIVMDGIVDRITGGAVNPLVAVGILPVGFTS